MPGAEIFPSPFLGSKLVGIGTNERGAASMIVAKTCSLASDLAISVSSVKYSILVLDAEEISVLRIIIGRF